jgi:GDSL-like lipase/acylhydrolase family protein
LRRLIFRVITSSAKRWVHVAGHIALIVVGCLIGALIAEIAFRIYLVNWYPDRFNPRHDNTFGVYNVSLWEFDERFGYVYPAGRVVDDVGVAQGYVKDCDRISAINEFGNIGPVAGNWSTAALRIAVFGDSFSAIHVKGLTWPHFFQEILTERLKRPVAVMNFGRDGYGMLQMFDLAAAKVSEWKPDIVIIAFITDDLTRARFWRTVVGEGDSQRVLTTIDPVPNPKEDRAVDTYLLMASANYEWCKTMAGTGRVDAVLSRLIEKRRVLQQKARGPVPSVWDLRRSYLFDRIWRPNLFWQSGTHLRPAQNPRHAYSSYAQDARFKENLGRLRASGPRLVLYHLAFYPEIKANKEYLQSPQEAALLGSLESITEMKIFRTLDYVVRPVDRPERIYVSAEDYHPSLWGMKFYANAVAETLFREGILEQRDDTNK